MNGTTSRKIKGWSAFRTMLRYKCDFAGATFAEVNEAFSTQTCSACNVRSGPKGIAGLGIRAWSCSDCGTVHDRNVNAAKNILAAGRRRLAEGIPALFRAREDVKSAPGRNRTGDLALRRHSLYPLSYRG